MEKHEIEALTTWSAPREVRTKQGPRMLRTGPATEAFWSAWRSEKDALKQAGVSCSRDDRTGQWQACWWLPVSTETAAQRAEAREASRATDADVDVPIPDGLALLPFQRAGVAFASKRPATLFGDEMGLGKTIQAIATCNVDPDARSILIVCPASLKLNWQREWQRWDVKGLTVGIANGGWPTTEVVILNYDVLAKYHDAIRARAWDVMVVDEAHYLKNPKAKRTREVLGSRRRGQETASIPARKKLFLTGTPIVNRPIELWPLVEALDPEGLGRNFMSFARRYAGGHQTKFGWDFTGADHLDELQDKLRETCLVYDTEVYSEHGQVAIGKVVELGIPIRVWSKDSVGRMALKPVVAFSKIPYRGLLVKIHFAESELICTPDHRIFAYEGEKRASEIVAGDYLCSMPKAQGAGVTEIGFAQAHDYQSDVLFDAMCGDSAHEATPTGVSARQSIPSEDNRQGVRNVRRDFCCCQQKDIQKSTLLHTILPCKVGISNFLPFSVEFSGIQGEERSDTTGASFSDSAPVTRACEQGEATSASHGVCPTESRTAPRTGASSIGIGPRGYGDGCTDCDKWSDDICGYPDSTKPCDRSRWGGSCEASATAIGQTEGCRASYTRVLSVEILGMGDRGDIKRSGCKDFFVYDIEVADNHSYFANRILVHNCMIRRLKSAVLTELPAKRRQIIELAANGSSHVIRAEQTAVESHRERLTELQARVELAKASDNSDDYRAAVEALQAGTRAMFSEISKLRHETALAKVDQVIEHIDVATEDGGHKVVVFAWHHDVIAQFREHLGDRCVVLTGETPMVERQAAVDRFQSDPTCAVFIGSITAAGVGLTLTAASHVIFAELDWVPGNVSQAEDRCHRIGQVDSVLVQHLVLEGSLDATMAKTLVEKQSVIDAALDAERQELAVQPVTPTERPASASVSRTRLEKDAEAMTNDQRLAAHEAVRMLAGLCDGARTMDGSGFSKIDVTIGHDLAEKPALSPLQAALARRIAWRYHKTQLPETIGERMGKPS